MNSKNIKKELKEGCFYIAYDAGKKHHPGMIYWKNERDNLYLAITTGTSEESNENFDLLSEPTEEGKETSYLNKRPFLGKRKDFGSVELTRMKFHIGDVELILKAKRRRPRESKNIKSRDRYHFKKSKPESK